MFERFVNKGLPMSTLLILSALLQGLAIRVFA
jgi:hypothetical protein